MREVDAILTDLSDKIDDIKNHLNAMGQIFFDVKILDRFSHYGNRLEFERYFLFF